MPERTDADDNHAENNRAEEDRRRSVRFICGGQAKISRLPSDGILIPGTIRDLSLHGCCIDTTLPLDRGVRAEIVVCVNAASFRAVGEVRAIRGRFGAGMEFVHLSAGGKDLLAEMIADLARFQAVMNKLKSARREMDEESFRKELEDGKLQAAMLSQRFPFLRTILTAESSGEGSAESSGERSGKSSERNQPASAGQNRIVESQPFVIAVDLFG